MPIYEYRCQACGAPKEAIQKMSDPPLVVCDACGAAALTRLMSRTSFVLKGGGWYATDYKSTTPKSEAKAEGAGENKESKPAATAAAKQSDG